MNDSIEQAAELIARSRAIWIGAGAGMGVDSGLPDFRGDDGFWNAYPAYRHLGLSFYDLANPRWFAGKPSQAWGFYGHRMQLYRETIPHEGFQILRKWADAKGDNCFVFTSNVDGQFQSAGFREEQIVECHGSIHHLQCSRPCGDSIWTATGFRPEIDDTTMQASDPLPECERCSSVARPNILMFGDRGWVPDRTHLQETRYNRWLKDVGSDCVMLEFGAGTAVPTVRYEAQRLPGSLIRVNPRESGVRDGIGVDLGALEFLQRVDDLME